MHELSIANSILDAVRTEAARRPGARVLKVGVRVGELCGIQPDALGFGFEVLVRGSELEPLTLEIEACPRRQRCPECGREFQVYEFDIACPGCGEERTRCVGGDELDLTYIEIEES